MKITIYIFIRKKAILKETVPHKHEIDKLKGLYACLYCIKRQFARIAFLSSVPLLPNYTLSSSSQTRLVAGNETADESLFTVCHVEARRR